MPTDNRRVNRLAVRQAEIVGGGKSDVSAIGHGREPSGFAYPHGRWNEATREVVIRARYRWVVTTRHAKVNRRRFDRFALPRLGVGDWSGLALLRAMDRDIVP